MTDWRLSRNASPAGGGAGHCPPRAASPGACSVGCPRPRRNSPSQREAETAKEEKEERRKELRSKEQCEWVPVRSQVLTYSPRKISQASPDEGQRTNKRQVLHYFLRLLAERCSVVRRRQPGHSRSVLPPHFQVRDALQRQSAAPFPVSSRHSIPSIGSAPIPP